MQRIRFLLILAFLCAVAQGAWAADYNVGTESELRGAISNGANIKLTADIALSNCLEIGDGGSSTPTVTIDLNGKTLSRSLEAADADGHVIWVRTGSTLTVTDGSGDNSGKLTGGYANNGGGICNYGTLYFQGGTITSCQTDYTGGDPSNLYLGVKDGKSALFYPAEGQDRTINSFRAYFHVDLSSGSQTSNGVRAFVLNFGDNDETTGIVDIEHGIFLDEPSGRAERNIEHSAGAGWYDLSGRKLQGKPTAKGIYIYKGKKVIK